MHCGPGRLVHTFCLNARHEALVDLDGKEELDRMAPDEKDRFAIFSNTRDSKHLTDKVTQFDPRSPEVVPTMR